ncbi:hypothetical protein [Brevibacillus marinus]|uniref:hypothetical protein n=1 Tax=Brevibacillus marinus TaxID=2496837 RepID=UPI000F8226C9|nr:hypothetical protein [Brevibacillus marinus]
MDKISQTTMHELLTQQCYQLAYQLDERWITQMLELNGIPASSLPLSTEKVYQQVNLSMLV